MIRLPFISRAHHEDVAGELRAQIAERDSRIAGLEDERRRFLDRFAQKAFGFAVYEATEEPPVAVKPAAAAEDIPADEVGRAIQKVGTRNPRAIVRAINEEHQARFAKDEAQRLQIKAVLEADFREGEKRAAAK